MPKNTKKKKSKPAAEPLLSGVLDITRSGMGFVAVDTSDTDIMVRPNDFNTAMHGDRVRVRVTSDRHKIGRLQGVVTEVLHRHQTQFIGRLEVGGNFAFFMADSSKSMSDIYIPLNRLNGAIDKDRVMVRIIQWEKNKKPQGEVVQVLNAADENDFAMKELIMDAGFPVGFSDEVLEESGRLPDLLSAEEINKRKDFRQVLTVTIDPTDAKDFDDAISLRSLKNGNYEVGVHIADVSYYVQPGSELDKSAYERATSVYLPDRVNPMLPERISNELCSLRPNEDKFTFSAVFEMTEKGKVKKTWIGRTVIHSDHRFAYEEAQRIIEKEEGPYQKEILLLNKIARRLREERFKNGAINFSSVEVKFRLDENGKPIGVMLKENKEANQLVEEFMLLANRAVAEAASRVKIDKKPLPFPYRVHDTPDEEKLLPFIEFARKYGHQFDRSSPDKIAASFNQLLADAQGKPEQHVLEQLGIRTMAKAVYSPENVGHYGLGFENYTHFTSPIRRYPDIMVHRIIQELLDESVTADKKMTEKCKHCSEREKAAMETERAANKYKQVEFMMDKLGEEFDGVISGVSSFGFWVETIEHKCEGLVSITSLSEYDDFRHVETDYCLAGRRSGRTFRMGDKIRIKLIAANLTKRQLDYQWVLTGGTKADDSGKQPQDAAGVSEKQAKQGKGKKQDRQAIQEKQKKPDLQKKLDPKEKPDLPEKQQKHDPQKKQKKDGVPEKQHKKKQGSQKKQERNQP